MSADTTFHPAPGSSPGTSEVCSQQWREGAPTAGVDIVADEVPVAIAYNGVSHAVMLATPRDLEDFGIGFSLTEGIVRHVCDILDWKQASTEKGVVVAMTITKRHGAPVKMRPRSLAGRTGCGLCGTQQLDDVFRPVPRVESAGVLDVDAIYRALESLQRSQPLHALTGAVHAAACARPDGSLALVREDVGRHNALDKLVGAMARRGMRADDGFVLLTSRASSEMVQKAAVAGVPIVAAISGPTSLAIAMAQQLGVTLVGFLRGDRHTVYTHPERIRAMAEAMQ